MIRNQSVARHGNLMKQSADLNQSLQGRQITLHRFFKTLSIDQHFSVMLGGSLQASPLNQSIFIGLRPAQIISLSKESLRWLSPSGKILQEKTLSSSAELWEALYQSPCSNQSFVFTGYEWHRYCDQALWKTPCKNQADAQANLLPDLLLVHFKDVGRFDCASQTWHWQSTENQLGDKRLIAYQSLWESLLAVSCSDKENNPQAHNNKDKLDKAVLGQYQATFQSSFDQPGFARAVSQIQSHITQGDLYQANLSLKLEKTVEIDCPYALYERLCDINPAPFSAFLKTPWGLLLCNSPERLIDAKKESEKNDTGPNQPLLVSTRPIAGTRGRGKTEAQDAALADTLLNNPKERAEHLMLVDLLRNDLGKICQAGTIRVNELFSVERYAHLMHLVSNIQGTLNPAEYPQPQEAIWRLFCALFPGGTITGCPKLRCVEILNELEPVSRGFYTGSLGYMNLPQTAITTSQPKPLSTLWGGQALDMNILIRTMLLSPLTDKPSAPKTHLRYNARIQVGAGIVADSIGAHEYRECQRKAETLLGVLYAFDHTAVQNGKSDELA